MLVLGRHCSERILVNGGFEKGGVTITVIEIRGKNVRLGIEAPIDWPVHREEVAAMIAAEEAKLLTEPPSQA